MVQRTRSRATLRQALSFAAVALALVLSPGHGVPFAGGGGAEAFDLGKIVKSLQPKKKRAQRSTARGAQIRFSIFSEPQRPRRSRRAKPAEVDEPSVPPPPQLGQVTAYRYAKVEALLADDPERIAAANAMLKDMFGGELSDRKIASFDSLLKIDATAALLGAGDEPKLQLASE